MLRRSRKWILFTLVLCAGLLCRWLNDGRTLFWATMLGFAQTAVYTGLVTFWGISVHHRIVVPQVRRLLEAVSGLLFLWFLSRGVKYYVLDILWFPVDVTTVGRYLWYSYYIPMLLLPVVLIWVALSLRRPEFWRMPGALMWPLLGGCMGLLLAVFTNDLHQLVFRFPENAVFSDKAYRYGPLYYVCLAWIVGCCVAAVGIMIRKCRLPNKRMLWLPLLPIGLCMAYTVLYITGNASASLDVTVVNSFSLMAILEMAITVGLIPSNAHYVELFRASNLPALITDKALRPVYTSVNMPPVPQERLVQAAHDGAVTADGMRLSAYPIAAGYVFWQEDVHGLLETIERLEDLNEDLEGRHAVLQEEYGTQHRRHSLEEKNRLYNMMQTQTKDKIDRLYALADALEQGQSVEAEIAMLSAYLKRRNNLIFIAEEDDRIEAAELGCCLRESLNNLELEDSNLVFDLSGCLTFAQITGLYDAFEQAIEAAFPHTRQLLAVVREEAGEILLSLNLHTAADLTGLEGFCVEKEAQEEWTLMYTMKRGVL